MKVKTTKFWSLACAVVMAGLSGNASAILLDRGGGMIYDDQLNITWVKDASLCATLNNCVNRDDSIVTGGMNWDDANLVWAVNLVYGGFSDWRLATINLSSPTTTVHDCSDHDAAACKASGNELGYMYYINLGANVGDDKTGNQTAGSVTLENIQPFYWSSTEFNSQSLNAWLFIFDGGQINRLKGFPLASWAVRPGDVCDAQPRLCAASVPEPGSLLLLALGALGLGWSRRRR